MFYSGNKIKQKGAVLVEFALVLPVLMLIIMGTFELGWALYIQDSLEDAAREADRVAVTSNITNLDIISAATSMLTADDISTTYASVTINPLTVSLQTRGTPITVEVSVPYKRVSILPTPLFLGNTTLTATVTMAKEY